MPQFNVKPRNRLANAMATVAPSSVIRKLPAVAAPGERTVDTLKQTVTSAGITPQQSVAVATAAAAASPAASATSSTPTPAGIAGSVNFGSLTGSVSGKWMMWGVIALGAYIVLRRR
jgi:hypothetical protein